MFTGQVESASFPNLDSLYVRYTFQHGPDWKIAQGIDAGFSQEAQKGGEGDSSIVWNFPIDVTFKSTNPFGWPRLVLSVYSKVRRHRRHCPPPPPIFYPSSRAHPPSAPYPPPSLARQDFLGRYVIRGYGSVLLPTTPGRYVRYVRTFAPASSTLLQAALAWLTGALPEFYDSRFAASGKGREVVRTVSTGVVRVAFNVVTRGMAAHGYLNGAPPDMPDLDAESVVAAAGAAPGARALSYAPEGPSGASSSRRALGGGGGAPSAASAASPLAVGGSGAFAVVGGAAAPAAGVAPGAAKGSDAAGGEGGAARERRAGGEEGSSRRHRGASGERRRSSSRSKQPGEEQPRGGVVAVEELAGGGKSDA
jgi:B9 domain-containing protein 1